MSAIIRTLHHGLHTQTSTRGLETVIAIMTNLWGHMLATVARRIIPQRNKATQLSCATFNWRLDVMLHMTKANALRDLVSRNRNVVTYLTGISHSLRVSRNGSPRRPIEKWPSYKKLSGTYSHDKGPPEQGQEGE